MQLNLILRRLIIVLGGLGLLILVGWFIWSRWPTTPTEPAPPLATDFFPGGEERLPPTKTSPDLLVDATSTPLAPNQVERTGDRLYPVSAAPASNLVSAGAATGSPLIFADRATGNLYLTDPNTDSHSTTTTCTTKPKSHLLIRWKESNYKLVSCNRRIILLIQIRQSFKYSDKSLHN
jgi:hypothetical protein